MMKRSHRLAIQQDRERRHLELLGVRAAQRIGLEARVRAIRAFRAGHDPRPVIKRVIVGDPGNGFPGTRRMIARGLVAAHLAGRYRTLLNVQGHKRLDPSLRLADTPYDGAIEFLTRRLALSQADLAKIQSDYNARALVVSEQASDALNQSLGETMLDLTRSGASVADGVQALRQTFSTEGFVPGNNYQLENIFRTQTQVAYGAGRYNALQDPALQDIIWGYEFVAIMDDRTTLVCQQCNGLVREKSDPVWQTYWPPNHFQCRSAVIEVLDQGEARGALPTIQPGNGFAVNFGQVYADQMAAVTEPVAA
jgi:SPP1 gp7 family putative phage head morphogenesis protein